MKISNAELNTKWNDYPSDTLYLWDGETIFKIAEGTGENLWPEDEEEGYVDYWMTESYSFNESNCNGGQWLETELITDIDYTIQGVLDRLMECDLWDSDWQILDEDTGNELFHFYEEYYIHKREIRFYKKYIDKLITLLMEGDE